ncbi:MAG: hypothetical protein R3176_00670 [Woeseiaceae bacterium]|nr:hypothetical protein [Woeseiaceae bacterium]
MADRRTRARIQLGLIALVFFGPLVLAAWLYYGGWFAAAGDGTNHGTLLTPIVSVPEALPDSPLNPENDGAWVLLYVNTGACAAACRDALYTLRQSRLMLGRDMERLRRVFLHGPTPPDTLFLAGEHQGLITIEDASLAGLLDNKRPGGVPAGGYFLLDPLGNLVMYFAPDIDPADMVEDIEHLLRLSRIG